LRLRHMARRAELTAYLAGRLDAGTITAPLPASLSREEQVFYFQGVYFSTALIQMSEAMSHLILALAQNPKVQDRLSTQLNDVHFFDDVIAESLRMFPLFGVAHRITSDAITLDDDTVLAKGSVLCFNYFDYQKSGFEDSGTFKPERWRNLTARDATYIPFGVTGNRPCPARALALITMRAAAAEFIREYVCYSTASHLRSLPNRGPCLLMRRGDESRPVMQRALLAWMKLRDRWADVWRSCVQLLLGTIMVLDARRLRLAHDYFASDPDEIESAGPAEGRGKCPFHS
jgi:hypothetical protein